MNKDEIQKRVDELGPWYLPIDLGTDIILPKRVGVKTAISKQRHDLIREARVDIDYKGKSVLDLGCAEGMWAFEAENLGAKQVLGVDISHPDMVKRAFFVKEVLQSEVIFYFNTPVQDLHNRLDHYFNWYTDGEKFDVVQHLGLFYHLRDPLLSLSQIRKCMKKGGQLLFETAVYDDDDKEPICLFNWNNRIYHDGTTWWAPNLVCLLAMLRLSLFEPNVVSIKTGTKRSNGILRLALTATAVGIETVSIQVGQVLRQGSNIGMDADV